MSCTKLHNSEVLFKTSEILVDGKDEKSVKVSERHHLYKELMQSTLPT
jgi:hypothetical protein